MLCGPLAADSPGTLSKGAVLPIRGVIDNIMRDSIERRLGEARAAGTTTIIFEMDTPGGQVTSALDICQIIKTASVDVRTVAWVHPHAFSAGAMISVACDEIWMSGHSSIGDCAPIVVVPGTGVQPLPEAERAKAESPILNEFRDSAARNGYDPLLSRAMVTVGEEVWWLEKVDGSDERRFVTGEAKKRLIDETDEDEREWKVVESYLEPTLGKEMPLSQPVDRASDLLTMSQYDAVAFGFARGILAKSVDLVDALELTGPPTYFEMSGWEKFASVLNSPIVRGILLIIALLGGYLEFQSPGLILPGATALVALAIFFAAPYAAGLANIWHLLVLAVGLILLGVEIFVIPGFGIAGIAGIVLIGFAVLATFVPAEPELPPFSMPSLPATWKGLVTGVKVLIGSLCLSLVGIFLLVRYLPESRLARGVITANPEADALALADTHPTVALVGDVGVVTGDLRPGGQARFGQEIVDVHSQGEFVEAGRRVQVISREGMQVVVRPLLDDDKASS